MKFKFNAGPGYCEDLSLGQAQEAAKERLRWLDAAKARHGGSIEALAVAEGEGELQAVMTDIKRLTSVIDCLKHGGDPHEPASGMRHPGGGHGYGKTRTVRTAGLKQGHWSAPFTREVKTLTPSGSITVPSLLSGLVQLPDRMTLLSQAVPVAETLAGTDQYAYLKETVRTLNAAETAAAALKPTSTLSVVKVSDRVRTIATLSQPMDRATLDDVQLLAAYIDGSLSQAVLLRLDSQILNGDGTGENLTGLKHTSGITTVAFATDLLTTTRKAVTQMEDLQLGGAGTFVLSTSAWESLELTQTSGSGEYVFGGSPVDRAAKRLWGRPVITTTALADGDDEGYLVDFAGSTALYERDTVRVDWSEAPVGSVASHTAFETNQLIFRAEGRWGFAVTRPAAVVQFATVGS